MIPAPPEAGEPELLADNVTRRSRKPRTFPSGALEDLAAARLAGDEEEVAQLGA